MDRGLWIIHSGVLSRTSAFSQSLHESGPAKPTCPQAHNLHQPTPAHRLETGSIDIMTNREEKRIRSRESSKRHDWIIARTTHACDNESSNHQRKKDLTLLLPSPNQRSSHMPRGRVLTPLHDNIRSDLRHSHPLTRSARLGLLETSLHGLWLLGLLTGALPQPCPALPPERRPPVVTLMDWGPRILIKNLCPHRRLLTSRHISHPLAIITDVPTNGPCFLLTCKPGFCLPRLGATPYLGQQYDGLKPGGRTW